MGEQITGGYDPGTITHFKGILLARRVEVMTRLQKNGSPVFVEELFNGVERKERSQTMELVERHNAEVIGDRELLRDIERSLQECEDGTYGRCSVCGLQILLARKEAIPTASRCVPCQAKHKPNNRSRDTSLFQSNPLGIFTEKEKVGRRAAI